ncbi:hypothetical protein AB0903_08305 [Streptomyces sp. NPDC048389]|uniref:hypothetical protein n=1 Tax=Streptomyces sp. NPDC048389 TaxID=3154622 RepID=UPI003451A250
MGMQQYELEAWLGDDHKLTDDQLTELLATADEIADQYPDPDDQPLAEQALVVAYRLMIEPAEDVVTDFGEQRAHARALEAASVAGLQQAARTLIPARTMPEATFSQRAGIDRMAVRRWLGKRP